MQPHEVGNYIINYTRKQGRQLMGVIFDKKKKPYFLSNSILFFWQIAQSSCNKLRWKGSLIIRIQEWPPKGLYSLCPSLAHPTPERAILLCFLLSRFLLVGLRVSASSGKGRNMPDLGSQVYTPQARLEDGQSYLVQIPHKKALCWPPTLSALGHEHSSHGQDLTTMLAAPLAPWTEAERKLTLEEEAPDRQASPASMGDGPGTVCGFMAGPWRKKPIGGAPRWEESSWRKRRPLDMNQRWEFRWTSLASYSVFWSENKFGT